jgi:glycerol-3-phosphate O-acyltransferase
MKLSEESSVVSAFASAYTRLIIYPSRSYVGLDPEKDKDEIIRGNAINRAAMKTLLDIKVKGKLILVFPSGTRYRPWDPSTKRGLREIDSYIKSFDYMCPIALNGEILHVRQGDMMEDSVSKDIVRITAGKVISCSEFRGNIHHEEDRKQAVVDAIMVMLEEMHIRGEENRKKLL